MYIFVNAPGSGAGVLFADQKELGRIISLWPHLTRLTLFIVRYSDGRNLVERDSDSGDEEWLYTLPLYQAVNSLSSLKHLKMCGMLYCKDLTLELDKVWPRLEHLSLTYPCMDFNLESILARLEPNFRSLRLWGPYEESDDILSVNFPRLVSNITELRLTNVNEKMFNLICDYFQLLKTLEMHFEDEKALDSNLISRFNRLSQFESRLVHVCVNLNTKVTLSSPVRALQLVKLFVKPNDTDGVLFVNTLKKLFPHLEQLDYYSSLYYDYPFALERHKVENFLRAQFSHLLKSRFSNDFD